MSPSGNELDDVWGDEDDEELASACGHLSLARAQAAQKKLVDDADNPWSAGSGPSFARDCTIWVDAAAGEFKVAGVPVVVSESAHHGQRDTGMTVWDGSLILSKFLELQIGREGIAKHNVLELGSGTGLCGASAGVLGAPNVWLTDLDYCLPNLHETVAANEDNVAGRLHVKALDWKQGWTMVRQELGGMCTNLGLILAADVVWLPDLVEPMCSTLQQVLDDQAKNTGEALKSCACCGDGNGMVVERADSAHGDATDRMAHQHADDDDVSDMLGLSNAAAFCKTRERKRAREELVFSNEAAWLGTPGRGAVAYLCYTFRFDAVHALLMRNISERFCASLVDARSIPFAQHSFDESPPVQVYRIQTRCHGA